MSDWPASRLCDLASDWLMGRYPGALIVRELSIGSWGGALLDIAAITDDEIVGVEIKGDGDSPSRIALQAAIYSKAATRMFMLPAPSLEGKVFRHTPRCWGRLNVADGQIVRAEPSSWDRDRDPAKLCTAPEQLLQALWRDELIGLARRLGVAWGAKLTREGMTTFIAEHAPLKDIRTGACAFLRARDWAKFGKRVQWSPPLIGEAA